MPVLSRTIIDLEKLMMEWEDLGKHHDFLKLWMDISMKWVTEYYS